MTFQFRSHTHTQKLLELNISQPNSFRWLPHCASLFNTFEDLWLPLIPKSEQVAPVGVQEFFNCVAALMSLQLRSLVIESLEDLLYFFTVHEVCTIFVVLVISEIIIHTNILGMPPL